MPNQVAKGQVRTVKVFGILFGFVFILIFSASFLGFRTFWSIEGLAAGFAFGLAVGAWLCPRILRRTENHKDSIGWKEYLGPTIPLLILYLLATQISLVFSASFLVAQFIATSFVEITLFLLYERKKNVFIVQNGWFGVAYSLIQQTTKNGTLIFPDNNQIGTNELLPDRKSWILFLTVGTFVIVIPATILWLSSNTSFFNNEEGLFTVFLSFGIGILFALIFSDHYRLVTKKSQTQETLKLTTS